jgi:hypothetical protein
MTGPATGPAPAVRPAPSGGEPVAARRPAGGLVRWGVALLVSGAILAYLFAAQGVDPRALVPLVRAISVPGLLASSCARSATGSSSAGRWRSGRSCW